MLLFFLYPLNFSLLMALSVLSTCQSSSGNGWLRALWRNLIEEKIFLMEAYPIVQDSSLAKAMRVSLSVGQAGLPNFTQKRRNCLMLLLLFLLVPSAYIIAWESLAFLRRALNWAAAAPSTTADGPGQLVEGGGGGGGGGGGAGCDGAAGGKVLLMDIFWPGWGCSLVIFSILARPGPAAPWERREYVRIVRKGSRMVMDGGFTSQPRSQTWHQEYWWQSCWKVFLIQI